VRRCRTLQEMSLVVWIKTDRAQAAPPPSLLDAASRTKPGLAAETLNEIPIGMSAIETSMKTGASFIQSSFFDLVV
jgi:hypothetical protein